MADFAQLAKAALKLIAAKGRIYVIVRQSNQYDPVTGEIVDPTSPVSIEAPAEKIDGSYIKLAATALRLIAANGRKLIISRTSNEYNNITGAIILAPPVMLTPPVISGDPFVGSVLSVTTGTWEGVVTYYAYQWKKNGVNIADAYSDSYTIPSSAFNDDEFTCIVAASNRDASTQYLTDAIVAEIPPINTVPAAVTGNLTIGSTLTVTPGAWRNAVSLAYQWFKNDIAITGQQGLTYVIPAGTYNDDAFYCKETATNAHAEIAQNSNTVLAKVRPVAVVNPVVSGTPTIGSVLTATNAVWNGADSVFQSWTKNNVQIDGADQLTYTIPSGTRNDDVFEFAEVAINENGGTSSVSNPIVAEVLPVSTMPPLISGEPYRNEILTASPGTWIDADTVTGQWSKDGVPISGATSLHYTIPNNADADASFTYVEYAINEHGTTEEDSNAIIVEVPVISGSALPGNTLSSTHSLPWLLNDVQFATASLTVVVPYTVQPGNVITQKTSNQIVVDGAEWNFDGGRYELGNAAPLVFSRSSEAYSWRGGKYKLGPENLVPNANDLTAWTRTGSPIVNATTDAQLGAATLVRVSSTNYITLASSYTWYGPWSLGFWIKPSIATGTLLVRDPLGGAFGEWAINLATIGLNAAFITRNHPAVTINTEFNASGSAGGLRFISADSGNRTFTVSKVQINRGNVLDDYLPSSGSAKFGIRIEEDPLTNLQLGSLLEAAHTNVLVRSADISTSNQYWTYGNLTSAAVSAKLSCIDGQTAWNHASNGVANECRIQTQVVANSTDYYFSVIVEKGATPAAQLHFGWFNGAAWAGLALFTWATKTLVASNGAISFAKVQALGTGPNGGEMVRLSCMINTGAAGTKSFRIYPNSYNVITPGQSTIIHHIQMETGGVSSPIVSGISSAIRQADSEYVNNLSWMDTVKGVFLIKVRSTFASLEPSTRQFIEIGSGADRIEITTVPSSAGRPQGRIGNVTTYAGAAAPIAQDQWEYLALSYVTVGTCFFGRRVGASAAASAAVGTSVFSGVAQFLMTLNREANANNLYVRYFPLEVLSASQLNAFLNALP